MSATTTRPAGSGRRARASFGAPSVTVSVALGHGPRRARQVGEQPGRKIYRHHRTAGGVDVVRDGGKQAVQRTLQPGPEERVHDEAAGPQPSPVRIPAVVVEHLRDGNAGLPCPVQIDAGVAGHLGRPREQEPGHVPAAPPHQPGRHPAVAAVVPAATENRRRARPARHVRLDGGDDLFPGTLHQVQRRNPMVVDRAALGVAHLRRREDAHPGDPIRCPYGRASLRPAAPAAAAVPARPVPPEERRQAIISDHAHSHRRQRTPRRRRERRRPGPGSRVSVRRRGLRNAAHLRPPAVPARPPPRASARVCGAHRAAAAARRHGVHGPAFWPPCRPSMRPASAASGCC